MKIAVPVKTNQENPPLAPLFGKAKWFAIIESGQVTIEPNPVKGGAAVIAWLASEGVEVILFQEMGHTPYEMIKETGTIDLFHAGYERILLEDALERFEADKLEEIDDTNIDPIIAHHEAKHSH